MKKDWYKTLSFQTRVRNIPVGKDEIVGLLFLFDRQKKKDKVQCDECLYLLFTVAW